MIETTISAIEFKGKPLPLKESIGCTSTYSELKQRQGASIVVKATPLYCNSIIETPERKNSTLAYLFIVRKAVSKN